MNEEERGGSSAVAGAPPSRTPDEAPEGDKSPTAADGDRLLTEVQEMRALTHPVRLALLEVLGFGEALTATEAGERIGESPTTCSFHLRQLAKYGFVEEAGNKEGRKRPWRLVKRGISFSGAGDAELSVAATELSHLLVNRWLGRYQAWQAAQVYDAEPRWAEATGASEHIAFLTVEETARLQADVRALVERYQERRLDPSKRPSGSRAIETVVFVHPYDAGS